MGFDLGDIAKWVNGLRRTIDGKPQNSIEQNIYDGIVAPGKVLSDFSGVSQGLKATKPDSSNLDKGLALLALMGFLGGQEAAMGLKGALTPEYAYGLHVSPTQGIKKISSTPETAIWDEMDNVVGDNYFWNTRNPKHPVDSFKQMQTYIDYYRKRTPDGMSSVYSVRTPLKHVRADENYAEIGLDALRTPKKLKIVDSIRTAGSGVDRFSEAPKQLQDSELFYDFLKKVTKGKKSASVIPELIDEDSRILNKAIRNHALHNENPTTPIKYIEEKLPPGKVYAKKPVKKKP